LAGPRPSGEGCRPASMVDGCESSAILRDFEPRPRVHLSPVGGDMTQSSLALVLFGVAVVIGRVSQGRGSSAGTDQDVRRTWPPSKSFASRTLPPRSRGTRLRCRSFGPMTRSVSARAYLRKSVNRRFGRATNARQLR
jgi:hypothetical protein